MSLRTRASARKRPVATRPAYVTGATVGVGAGTSASLTIPAGASVGQWAFVLASSSVGSPIDAPAGWTLHHRRTNVHEHSLWYRVLQAGDPGLAQNWTMTPSGSIALAMSVYSGVGGISEWPTTWYLKNPAVNEAHMIPAMVPGPSDLGVCWTTGRAVTATTANAASVNSSSGFPANFNLRQSISARPGLGTPWASNIMDGIFARLTNYTVQVNAATHAVAGGLLLHPAIEPPVEDFPPSLVGGHLHILGESYTCIAYDGIGALANVNAWATWFSRIWSVMRPASVTWTGIVGAESSTIANFHYGTFTIETQATVGKPEQVTQAGTWYARPNRTSGLVLLDLVGNDALRSFSANHDRRVVSCTTAVHALLHLIRSQSRFLHNDASIVKTGTWTTVSSTDMSGGAGAYTATTGDYFTITAAADTIDIVLMAVDNDNNAAPGADFEVRVDGVLVQSGTTSNKHVRPTNHNFSNISQQVVTVSGMGGGSHSIEVRRTGAASTARLYLDSWMTPNATPPWILLNCSPTDLDPAENLTYMVEYRDFIKAVGESYTDGRVITYSVDDLGKWNRTTMLGDPVHMNELGNALYAEEQLNVLRSKIG